jgi:hypothetical protein
VIKENREKYGFDFFVDVFVKTFGTILLQNVFCSVFELTLPFVLTAAPAPLPHAPRQTDAWRYFITAVGARFATMDSQPLTPQLFANPWATLLAPIRQPVPQRTNAITPHKLGWTTLHAPEAKPTSNNAATPKPTAAPTPKMFMCIAPGVFVGPCYMP